MKEEQKKQIILILGPGSGFFVTERLLQAGVKILDKLADDYCIRKLDEHADSLREEIAQCSIPFAPEIEPMPHGPYLGGTVEVECSIEVGGEFRAFWERFDERLKRIINESQAVFDPAPLLAMKAPQQPKEKPVPFKGFMSSRRKYK